MKSITLPNGSFYTSFEQADNYDPSLYITTVGKLTVSPGEPHGILKEYPEKYSQNGEQGRVLDEFQFVYISEGSGWYRSFEREFFVGAGSLISVVPGERHRYGPDPQIGWTEYWIGFSGSLPREWIAREYLGKVITVNKFSFQREILVPFTEAVDFAREQNPAFQILIASCVMRILGYLVEHRRLQAVNYDLIEQAKLIFEKNLYFPIDMEELARILNNTYQQIRERFREETGLSPYQYFLQMKINRAKKLLQEGTMSIKEIAYKLSFESPYYFSRLFKRKTGVSPSQWNNTTSPKDLDLWDN